MPHHAPGGPTVGLLFDSFSDNVGDIAMADATRAELARVGVHNVEIIDLFSPEPRQYDAVLVGGGELIRPTGDAFYDRFRLPHATMLNAAGIWPDAGSLDYLKDYSFVSARSSAEVSTLRSAGIEASLAPCVTSTLDPEKPDEDEAATLPETSHMRVGIHYVPETIFKCPGFVDTMNSIHGEKLLIPFTRYLSDGQFMGAFPLEASRKLKGGVDLSPANLKYIISQMDLVIASSLHVTIFALTTGTPFVSMDQPKVRAYLEDRGLSRLLFHDDESLLSALESTHDTREEILQCAANDCAKVHERFEEFAQWINQSDRPPVLVPAMSLDPQADRRRVLAQQTAHVLAGRDRLIGTLFTRQSELATTKQLLDGQTRWSEELAGALEAQQRRSEELMEFPGAKTLARLLRQRTQNRS